MYLVSAYKHKSKLYKFVYIYKYTNEECFKAEVKRIGFCKFFKDERTAAKAVDIALIKHGFDPVNILIKNNKMDIYTPDQIKKLLNRKFKSFKQDHKNLKDLETIIIGKFIIKVREELDNPTFNHVS